MTPSPYACLGAALVCARLAVMGEVGGVVMLWIACAACLVAAWLVSSGES